MATFTDVREAIAAAIVDDTTYNVISFPVATPMPNTVLVMPSDPYITPNTIASSSFDMNFSLECYTNTADNQADLVTMENILETVLNLIPDYAVIDSVTAPDVFAAGSTYLTRADIKIRLIASME